MKLLRKYKFTTFVVIVFIIMVIVANYLYKTFTANTGKSVCGGRNGYVEITPEDYDKLQTNVVDGTKVLKLTSNIGCEVFSVTLTVKNDITKVDAKKYADLVVKQLSTAQTNYYDIQVFIKKEDTSQNDFPIAGYKHNASNTFSWSKDREVTTDETK